VIGILACLAKVVAVGHRKQIHSAEISRRIILASHALEFDFRY
jgi:carbonic anhydrase/acetyltransferase-like protein (isoleucine patch superfamily)